LLICLAALDSLRRPHARLGLVVPAGQASRRGLRAPDGLGRRATRWGLNVKIISLIYC
jgi:hypothetical protein